MSKIVRFALMASVLSSVLLAGCDFEPRTKDGVPLSQAQAEMKGQVVEEMRIMGQALVAWQQDQLRQGSSGTSPTPCREISSVDGTTMDRTFELGRIPHVPWEVLQAKLVPKYLSELPAKDMWGKGYDFRVNLTNLNCPDALAIRSAGPDRQFGRARYVRSSFDPADQEADLVWASGDFVRWPDPNVAQGR